MTTRSPHLLSRPFLPDGAARRLRHALGAAALAGTLLASATPASAQWGVGQLDALSQAFSSAMAGSYAVTAYPWTFMTNCEGKQCGATNPDTVYGLPDFGAHPGQKYSSRTMDSTGALVLIMETPPPMRYFGITPYLYTKTYAGAKAPAKAGTVAVFESMTDTTNLAVVGTTGSPQPGSNVFTQLAVFVVTADAGTSADVAGQLASLGLPAQAVNLLDLPLSVTPAVPLAMGNSPLSDTYMLFLRMTYPVDAARLADYVQRAPIRSYYIAPKAARASSPLPSTVYRTPGNGTPEPDALRSARDQLVGQLLTRYGAGFRTVTESQVVAGQTRNYRNVRLGIEGSGDNPDAVYAMDLGGQGDVAPGLDDRILVVGVNHGLGPDGTGKATYFSHSLTDAASGAGVMAVADSQLAGSGLLAAGISDPADPRYALYRHLYAFTMSFRCPPDDALCVTIPQPGDDGGGIALGSKVQLIGRVYLDPATWTRPSIGELILERAFVMLK